MPIRLRAAALALAALALVGGCKDASGPDLGPDEGTMGFTFSGDTAGTFSARGVPPTGAPYADSYTRGFIEPTDGNTYLIGYQGPGAGERLVLILAGVPEAATGTVVSCAEAQSLAQPCFHATFYLGFNPGVSGGTKVYQSSTGTLRITENGPERIRGTFSAGVSRQTGPSVTISNGTFDFPLPTGPAAN